MIAIEVVAPIINHRVEFGSQLLPEHRDQAKIIVMYDEHNASPANAHDIVSLARAARASFPKDGALQLRAEVATSRDSWDKRGQRR